MPKEENSALASSERGYSHPFKYWLISTGEAIIESGRGTLGKETLSMDDPIASEAFDAIGNMDPDDVETVLRTFAYLGGRRLTYVNKIANRVYEGPDSSALAEEGNARAEQKANHRHQWGERFTGILGALTVLGILEEKHKKYAVNNDSRDPYKF